MSGMTMRILTRSTWVRWCSSGHDAPPEPMAPVPHDDDKYLWLPPPKGHRTMSDYIKAELAALRDAQERARDDQHHSARYGLRPPGDPK